MQQFDGENKLTLKETIKNKYISQWTIHYNDVKD